MTSAERLSWQTLFSDPRQWWDGRRSKETARHRRKKSTAALCLDSRFEPAWVDSPLTLCDIGMGRSPGAGPTAVQEPTGSLGPNQVDLNFGTCSKLCEEGLVTEAVDLLTMLVQRGCYVPDNLFYRVLKRCSKNLVMGRRIHALTIDSGYEGNAFLATHLIGLYASHRRLEEAMQVFSRVSAPDSYMWASIILAYARHGRPFQAVKLYRKMRQSSVKPDNHIFVAVLKACATEGDLASGRDVHADIVASRGKPNMFVQNCLIDMYAKCGSLVDAHRVFDRLAFKDVVTWTAMIAGYAQQGMGHEALTLYSRMQRECSTPPDSVTFVCLLQACGSVGAAALHQGKELHAQAEERGLQSDVAVGASLVNMYAKCGSLADARIVFDRLSRKNVVTWTAMIAGYTQQGMGHEALSLHSRMHQEGIILPNSVTFVCLLQACVSIGVAALQQGKQLHKQLEDQGLQTDLVVGNSLVNMYAKCESLLDAHRVFDSLLHKDVVTWNAMIAGYAQQGMDQEAISLYSSMRQEGVTRPNSVTFVCVLQACASTSALPLGKQLHAQIEEQGLQADVILGHSLVNMYSKCGSLEDAHRVFDSLPERQIVAWGALIAGYSRQGDSETVFDLVDRMKQDGIQPDDVMVLSVLTLCSHVGLVDKGRQYFKAMVTDYGISPTLGHYMCMMDLLGRAGHLDEVLQMVTAMPFQPDIAVWLTLLGACRKWGNVEIGQQAFESALKLGDKDATAYVLMSNIYAGAQMWEKANEMQTRRKKLGARKQPGRTWWMDKDGSMHCFWAGNGEQAEFVSTSIQAG